MAITNIGYNNIYIQEHWDRQRFNDGMVFFPKEKECTSLVVDVNSAARNSASTIKSIAPLPILAGSLVSTSAVIGGVLGVPIGLCGAHDGFKKAKAAINYGDAEGSVHNTLYGSFGAGYAAISGILAADGIMGLVGTALPASMTPVFGGLGLGMNGALLAYSAYGLKEAFQFSRDLKTVLAKGGEQEALNWLNGQVNLTRGDVAEIYHTAKDPDREIANRLQKQWNALELRTSPDCANWVREKLPGLLEKFDVQEAGNLIRLVEKASFKTRVKHILLIAIALISIAAFICLLLTAGPASPLLFAIGAVAWLAVDSSKLHNYIGEKCWSWHSEDKKPELPCQTSIA